MPFTYSRTVRFADTDAAGVVFFANYLAFCHEAYEESLAASGIELQSFFRSTNVIVPISKSEASHLRPLRPGDKLRISVTPQLLSENSFAIDYEIVRLTPPVKVASRVRTEHVATSTQEKKRVPLPPSLGAWVSAG
jgi:1,4-dihydroxy-2-naphthoyl-CoA hydrolase